jgi:hypothetical protein
MTKVVKALALSALLACGATYALAQGSSSSGSSAGGASQGGGGSADPTKAQEPKKGAPTNPTPPAASPGVGTRPIGPPTGTSEDSKDLLKKKEKEKH